MKRFIVPVLMLPLFAMASFSYMVTEDAVTIADPAVDQIYHDTLVGEARAYRMVSPDAWELSLSLLVPAHQNPNGRFDAVVVNESNGSVASILEAGGTPWVAHKDWLSGFAYLRGPELKQELPSGNYRIMVTSNGNEGKYALHIGTENKFAFRDLMSELAQLPELQKNYFKESPVGLFKSPLMLVYALLMLLIGGIFGVYVRHHLPRIQLFRGRVRKYFQGKNLDILGRVLRLLLGKVFFALAVFASWNPILLFIAGFSLYQAVSGWCAVFALTGRSSCAHD